MPLGSHVIYSIPLSTHYGGAKILPILICNLFIFTECYILTFQKRKIILSRSSSVLML